MLPVWSLYDVVYGIYETAVIIVSESEYRFDVHADALHNVLSNTMSCEENIFRVLGT